MFFSTRSLDRMSSWLNQTFLLLGFCLLGGPGLEHRCFADLQILGYDETLHDRFYVGVDKNFIGSQFDWSGYGRMHDLKQVSGNWKHLTMISDTYFVSAAHFFPKREDDPNGPAPARFYRTNDPNGEYWEGTIDEVSGSYFGETILNKNGSLSDLRVGRFTTAPPTWVKRYPLIKRPEGYNYVNLQDIDSKIYIVGQDSPRSYTSERVGRNEINFANEDAGLLSGVSFEGISFTYDDQPGTGLGADEALTQGGDSGAPSFAVTDIGLALAGTHSGSGLDQSISPYVDSLLSVVPETVSVVTDLWGDINSDFKVDNSDFSILARNWQQGPGMTYNDGDLNGDGFVENADYSILAGTWQSTLLAPSDFDGDFDVDSDDLRAIGNNWLESVDPGTNGDADSNGIVDDLDVTLLDTHWRYRSNFVIPPPAVPVVGDVDGNGLVDGDDFLIASGNWGLGAGATLEQGDVTGDGYVNGSDTAFIAGHWEPYGPADINEDLKVDKNDLDLLVANWETSTQGGKADGDLDGSGFVDADDFSILADWWGRGVKQSESIPALTVVPEPTSVILLSLGWLGMFAVRRRS